MGRIRVGKFSGPFSSTTVRNVNTNRFPRGFNYILNKQMPSFRRRSDTGQVGELCWRIGRREKKKGSDPESSINPQERKRS